MNRTSPWLPALAATLLACSGAPDAGSDAPPADPGAGDLAAADPSPDPAFDLPSDLAPDPPAPLAFRVATFNTGTSATPDGGPGSMTAQQAADCQQFYGNGLAWLPAAEAARDFLAKVDADVVVFQEIFPSESCADVPIEARPGFVCETWKPGDPTVAQFVAGPGWQVACNWQKHDKCAAVNRRFGTFRGCDRDLCLDGLFGATVDGCGKGARVGRGVIDLAAGGAITLVNVHGSSGFAADDQDCRLRQFHQLFEDLGDGAPAANGDRNLVMGDFNTDPVRLADGDPSAAYLASQVGPGRPFHFVTPSDPDAVPTYAGFVTIDLVISDALGGTCWAAGVTDGAPATPGPWFDHHPTVCDVGM